MFERSARAKQLRPDQAQPSATPQHIVLQLQQSAGNAAVARALRSAKSEPALSVQRTLGPIAGLGYLSLLIAAFGGEAVVEAKVRTGTFARLYRSRAGRWPSEVEWNAWGHCYVGYRMTTLSGGRLARLSGMAMEYFHSAVASIPGIGHFVRHNSLREDLHNQAVGIAAAGEVEALGDPMAFSLDALLSGRLQVAPPDSGEQGNEVRDE